MALKDSPSSSAAAAVVVAEVPTPTRRSTRTRTSLSVTLGRNIVKAMTPPPTIEPIHSPPHPLTPNSIDSRLTPASSSSSSNNNSNSNNNNNMEWEPQTPPSSARSPLSHELVAKHLQHHTYTSPAGAEPFPNQIRQLQSQTSASTLHSLRHSRSQTCNIPFPPAGIVLDDARKGDCLSEEDGRDDKFMGVCAALESMGNRALSLSEIGDICIREGWIRPSPAISAASIASNVIRCHIRRCTTSQPPRPPFIHKHMLQGSMKENRLAPALHPRAFGPDDRERSGSSPGDGEEPLGARNVNAGRRPRGAVWYMQGKVGNRVWKTPFEGLLDPDELRANPVTKKKASGGNAGSKSKKKKSSSSNNKRKAVSTKPDEKSSSYASPSPENQDSELEDENADEADEGQSASNTDPETEERFSGPPIKIRLRLGSLATPPREDVEFDFAEEKGPTSVDVKEEPFEVPPSRFDGFWQSIRGEVLDDDDSDSDWDMEESPVISPREATLSSSRNTSVEVSRPQLLTPSLPLPLPTPSVSSPSEPQIFPSHPMDPLFVEEPELPSLSRYRFDESSSSSEEELLDDMGWDHSASASMILDPTVKLEGMEDDDMVNTPATSPKPCSEAGKEDLVNDSFFAETGYSSLSPGVDLAAAVERLGSLLPELKKGTPSTGLDGPNNSYFPDVSTTQGLTINTGNAFEPVLSPDQSPRKENTYGNIDQVLVPSPVADSDSALPDIPERAGSSKDATGLLPPLTSTPTASPRLLPLRTALSSPRSATFARLPSSSSIRRPLSRRDSYQNSVHSADDDRFIEEDLNFHVQRQLAIRDSADGDVLCCRVDNDDAISLKSHTSSSSVLRSMGRALPPSLAFDVQSGSPSLDQSAINKFLGPESVGVDELDQVWGFQVSSINAPAQDSKPFATRRGNRRRAGSTGQWGDVGVAEHKADGDRDEREKFAQAIISETKHQGYSGNLVLPPLKEDEGDSRLEESGISDDANLNQWIDSSALEFENIVDPKQEEDIQQQPFVHTAFGDDAALESASRESSPLTECTSSPSVSPVETPLPLDMPPDDLLDSPLDDLVSPSQTKPALVLQPGHAPRVEPCKPINPPVHATVLGGNNIPVFVVKWSGHALLRRMDTDYVNVSALHNALRGSASSKAFSDLRRRPNAVSIPANCVDGIEGVWVPLAVSKKFAKSIKAPSELIRVLLDDSLADQFPPPLPEVKARYVTPALDLQISNPAEAFGTPFDKPVVQCKEVPARPTTRYSTRSSQRLCSKRPSPPSETDPRRCGPSHKRRKSFGSRGILAIATFDGVDVEDVEYRSPSPV